MYFAFRKVFGSFKSFKLDSGIRQFTHQTLTNQADRPYVLKHKENKNYIRKTKRLVKSILENLLDNLIGKCF